MTTCKAVVEIRAEEREIWKGRIFDLVEKGHLAPEAAADSREISVEELYDYIRERQDK